MGARSVDFYFDYISGYAYFGWLRIQDVCAWRMARPSQAVPREEVRREEP